MVATLLIKKVVPETSNYRFYKILFAICQLFCAAPVLDHAKSFKVKVHSIWCTVFLASIIYTTCYIGGFLIQNVATIQKALHFCEFIANTSLVPLSILTVYHYKEYYTDWPKRIKALESRTMIYQPNGQIKHNINEKVARLVYVGVLFFALASVVIYLNSENVTLALQTIVMYVSLNINIILVLGQYWILIANVTFEYRGLNIVLEAINVRIQHIKPCSIISDVFNKKSSSQWKVEAVLDDLKMVFGQLDTLVGDVNNVFGLIITATFLASFLSLNIQIFLVYNIADNADEFEWPKLLFSLLWIVIQCFKLILILSVNCLLLNEKAKTGTILNSIDLEDTQIEEAINRFLLQLVMRQSARVACGIIELDMGFLGGVMSALSIYVIFLIQVRLGEVSISAWDAENVTNTTITTPKGTL